MAAEDDVGIVQKKILNEPIMESGENVTEDKSQSEPLMSQIVLWCRHPKSVFPLQKTQMIIDQSTKN